MGSSIRKMTELHNVSIFSYDHLLQTVHVLTILLSLKSGGLRENPNLQVVHTVLHVTLQKVVSRL